MPDVEVAPDIVVYYQRMGERSRLTETGAGRLEFLRTWDVLGRVLPKPPATVLDVGGATGVYAGPLATAGYRVHVVDPVAEHVAAAGALPGVTAAVGDGRSLVERDASRDAVLLLGPLYHLLDRADRVRVWREARRVVRPDGVVVGAAISRFAPLMDGFARGSCQEPEYVDVVRQHLLTGEHHPRPENPLFTTAYFHHPAEIPGEVADAGLVLDRLVGVEGPLWTMTEPLAATLDEPDLMLDLLRTIETEPSILGVSAHILAVARRPA